ncbi:hypothetical protein GGF37_000818 [Kickxella alabastrina]|nr:hypothetical protein GGF37_000818 [Kickxella alabastrina]
MFNLTFRAEQLIERGDVFDDDFKYMYTSTSYIDQDGNAKLKHYKDVSMKDKLREFNVLADDAYLLARDYNFKVCKEPEGNYLKRQSFLDYEPGDDSAKLNMLREIEILELLDKGKGHPNICQYMGCYVKDGFIQGIFLKRYKNTLQESMESGLVHDDINPRNIMLDTNNDAFLIDFDSCKKIGMTRKNTKSGTLDWDLESEVGATQDLEPWTELLTYNAVLCVEGVWAYQIKNYHTMSTQKEKLALLLEKRSYEVKKPEQDREKTVKQLGEDFSIFSANAKNQSVDRKLDIIIKHLEELSTKVKRLDRKVNRSSEQYNTIVISDHSEEGGVLEEVDPETCITMIRSSQKIYIKRYKPSAVDSDMDDYDFSDEEEGVRERINPQYEDDDDDFNLSPPSS